MVTTFLECAVVTHWLSHSPVQIFFRFVLELKIEMKLHSKRIDNIILYFYTSNSYVTYVTICLFIKRDKNFLFYFNT